ncbi:MAG: PQQ-binding-like beta-propeller repeat protein, partial [Acidobacteriota bacterium]|nr:PQQ-binding-like beta-propeller repeat protein [Acidobacteriota bacterium]
MPGRTLTISLTLLLMAVVAVEVETAGPLPGSPTGDGIHMILPDGEAKRYWSRWRGPTGQGLAVGKGYPDTWSANQNVLWKVEVPGRGNSSPIVWADRIFLTTARDGGKRPSV